MTDLRASAKASNKASNVRTLALRSAALTLDQHSSMGLRSDEYGGKKSSWAPRASIASQVDDERRMRQEVQSLQQQVIRQERLAAMQQRISTKPGPQ